MAKVYQFTPRDLSEDLKTRLDVLAKEWVAVFMTAGIRLGNPNVEDEEYERILNLVIENWSESLNKALDEVVEKS